jgi:hypothetical protein
VRLVRGARQLALASGALDMLDRRRDRRLPLFLRSLFAVHDIEDLGRLDLPWWTFGAIERVDAFLRSRGGRARAFEYGAGASTLWLARRCARVVTVEHDREWWPPLAAHLKSLDNVEARCIPPVPSQRAPNAPRGAPGGAASTSHPTSGRSGRRAGPSTSSSSTVARGPPACARRSATSPAAGSSSSTTPTAAATPRHRPERTGC